MFKQNYRTGKKQKDEGCIVLKVEGFGREDLADKWLPLLFKFRLEFFQMTWRESLESARQVFLVQSQKLKSKPVIWI